MFQRRFLQDLFTVSIALTAVFLLGRNVYSSSEALDALLTPEQAEESDSVNFTGDRTPGLSEPSETPTGDNAELYLAHARRFDEARAARNQR